MEERHLTLAVIEREGKLLLGLKKRGYAEGVWNGYGGKVEKGESVEDAMARELLEESSLQALRMEKVGHLEFTSNIEDEISICHLFLIHEYLGEPVETEEMRPQWFSVDSLPYDQMWPDDPYWIPLVLSGKKVRGSFVLRDNKTVEKHSLTEVDSF